MDIGWNPVPKPVSKPKDKPKYKEKRPKKKKNPNLYRGRIVPTPKERSRITAEAYKRMIKEFGEYCLYCGHIPIEAHHIVFRSQLGSGNWRNLAPLCNRCHGFAHKYKAYADQLREERAKQFGKWYWADKYTLFKEGLINNTTDEAYERFMKGEEERAKSNHT
jgi:5-methylcytosine-specific restriction endonuclease McrA